MEAVREPFHCDFCGCETGRVRRVALDRDYDRLSRRHPVRYACEACSSLKDAARTELVDAPRARL